ncbi:MAG: hypothetical protein LGB66_06550 [Sulfurovum sp.]|nr:hypothetical protein [Sulfurovum sp.]
MLKVRGQFQGCYQRSEKPVEKTVTHKPSAFHPVKKTVTHKPPAFPVEKTVTHKQPVFQPMEKTSQLRGKWNDKEK